jgi:hypothetical protein
VTTEPIAFPFVADEKRKQAVELARAAAWTNPHGCDYCDHVCDPGTPTIHTMAGGFGADWSLEEAVEFIVEADECQWVQSIFGHDLAATKDGRTVMFQVKKP